MFIPAALTSAVVNTERNFASSVSRNITVRVVHNADIECVMYGTFWPTTLNASLYGYALHDMMMMLELRESSLLKLLSMSEMLMMSLSHLSRSTPTGSSVAYVGLNFTLIGSPKCNMKVSSVSSSLLIAPSTDSSIVLPFLRKASLPSGEMYSLKLTTFVAAVLMENTCWIRRTKYTLRIIPFMFLQLVLLLRCLLFQLQTCFVADQPQNF
eukprot:jgi/Antlo1/1796/1882